MVPCFNEGKNVGEVVRKLNKLGMFPLVIDDGSTDGTYIEAVKNKAVVIRHTTNKGKGEALRTAQKWLKRKPFDLVVLIDGDGQYDPMTLKDFPYWYAYSIGARDWSKVPFRHAIANRLIAFIFRSLYGTSLTDVCCGLVVMRKKHFESLDIGGGYVVDVDMVIQSLKRGIFPLNFGPVQVRYNKKRGLLSGVRIVGGIIIWMLKKRHIE